MTATSNTPEREERIIVCLSSSPSNHKVIAAAAKMAVAFRAALTAIYVKPSGYDAMSDADKARLQSNMRLAEQSGASIATVIGNDIPAQIAEYAHISGTTKIVVGRSGAKRQHFWSKPSLTEQIILNAPDVDVYIIPDSAADLKLQNERFRQADRTSLTWKDLLLTVLLLVAATVVGLVFTRFGFSEANIITVFILGVLIISVVTVSPVFSAISSLLSVLLFNWFFIEPKFSFHTYETEYVVTFGIMLISALITGTLANRLKENARRSAHEAFRTKVLFDTNQLLQKAGSEEEVIRITANQVITLLDRNVIFYVASENGDLGDSVIFTVARSEEQLPLQDRAEKEVARWVFQNGRIAGSGAEQYGKAKALYHPIGINDHGYGVIGIQMNERPLESFEYSVFMSILGECALALESLRNAAEKEQAAVLAHNEQLRANLLRSISHDIRTPLTSISGNASNLLSHYEQLDAPSREQIFADIYDDSQWLIHLVENLLSISRIENGQMRLHLSLDVVSDVVQEALRHADRKIAEHRVTVKHSDELLLVRMDAGLITQVLINLINNAVKNTPPGSEIVIETEGRDGLVSIAVSDDGPGIPDEMKPHIFEMFYTGPGKVADGRRGMGLGLALCRSILEAHGGAIELRDNEPSGCRFICTLPMEEVDIHE